MSADSRSRAVSLCSALTIAFGALSAFPESNAVWPECFNSRCQELFSKYKSDCVYSSAYVELILLERGISPSKGFEKVLDGMEKRGDCSDFEVPAVLYLLYNYATSPLVNNELLTRAKKALLEFKWWFDEDTASTSMCMWTENHQILFSMGAYLAGQLYPDDIFRSFGKTGRQLMAENRPRIARWLDLRFQTGFSEWLSNVYYHIDLPALISFIDLAEDEELVLKAKIVTDLLLLDIALNCFQGSFVSTHGRTNGKIKRCPLLENTNDTQWLLFGLNEGITNSMSAICLALSRKYQMPQVIYEIANDTQKSELVNRQRMGLDIQEGKRWGIGYEDLEDASVWLSMEAYSHPLTIQVFVQMLDKYNWWENPYFKGFKAHRNLIESWREQNILAKQTARYEQDLTRNMRQEVNIYTYRTPSYMLSAAQNYRAGYGGDQQQAWQASLGGNAVCFTTHPAQSQVDAPSPNYWTGDGWMPKVMQYKNVCFIMYDIKNKPGLYFKETLDFTHAWMPQDMFDEIVERDGWVCARKGSGYMALRSQEQYEWVADEAGKPREMISKGRENIWLCELGRYETHGSFDQFVSAISKARLKYGELDVEYESPSQGLLSASYKDDSLLRNAEEVTLSKYPRYSNPYVEESFPARRINVVCYGSQLLLDWENNKRDVLDCRHN